MKLVGPQVTSAIASIISLSLVHSANASIGPADNFYHHREHIGPSVWTFGNDGVSIYSVDGEIIKRLESNDICGGEDCMFREAISDGSRHVYASNSLESTIDVFSIATGDFVNSVDTCGSPWSLEYHPVRDELWVHCWSPNKTDSEGHVDVFSGGSMNSPLSQVALHETLGEHAHGSVEVDSSLGHYGYATDLDTPSLYKMDLNKKEVVETYDIDDISGLYRMAYSPVNKHLYLRTYVCCSCGFDGADLPACGKGEDRNVNVTTGPNPGTHNGRCGHSCEGSVADTIGVLEFNTVTGLKVATHLLDGAASDPYPSVYGDYIFLFGSNGGKTVRILKPRVTGTTSQVFADVELNLNADLASYPTAKAISDSIHIRDDAHDLVIFSSTLSNEIALVDLSGASPSVSKILLTESEEVTSNHGRGAKRNLVWPVGTNYVWVDSSKTNEFHIIQLDEGGDVSKAKLKETVTGLAIRQFLYVENYWATKATDIIDKEIEKENGGGSTTSDGNTGSNTVIGNQGMNSDDKTVDSVGIAGLVVGLIALLLGLLNLLIMKRRTITPPYVDDEQFREPSAVNV